MNNKRSCFAVALAFVVSVLQLHFPAWAQWASIAPMPTARWSLMAAAVGTKVYAIGGFESGGFCQTSEKVEVFDTVTGTWGTAAHMPTPRARAAAVAAGGKIYVISGPPPDCFYDNFNRSVEVYDPATDTWSSLAPMPEARFTHAAAALDGKIYVMGGFNWGAAPSPQASLFIYDIATDSWTTGAPMPSPRTGFGAAAMGGLIYAIGSSTAGDPDVVVYDPATNSWSARASAVPQDPYLNSVASLGDAIYSLGGVTLGSTSVILRRADRYDPLADTWLEMPSMLEPRWEFAAASVGGSIYAMGGGVDFSLPAVASAEVFTPPPAPSTDTTPPQVVVSATPSANASGWNNSNVTVTVSATDNPGGDGVVAVGYTVTNGVSTTGNGGAGPSLSFEISTSGTNTVTYAASDAAGNTTVGPPFIVRIDKAPPQAVASASPAPNAAGWNNTSVNVSLSATDGAGGSGVASVGYTVVNGASTTSATAPGAGASVDLSADGVNTVTFRATDIAGNTSAEQTLVVRIDRSGPSGSLSVSPTVLWPPNNKMVPITVTLTKSDAGGPVSVTGPVVTSNEAPSAAGDWEVIGTSLRLRASRNGDGSGRIYRIAYTLTNAAGNTHEVSASVTVPHDLGR